MRIRVLVSALVTALAVPVAGASPDATGAKIAPWLVSRLTATDSDSFLVLFDNEGTLDAEIARVRGAREPGRAVYDLLRRRAGFVQAGVHDLHLWSLGGKTPLLSAHLEVDLTVRGHEVLRAATTELRLLYGIDHVTLQIEPPDFNIRGIGRPSIDRTTTSP